MLPSAENLPTLAEVEYEDADVVRFEGYEWLDAPCEHECAELAQITSLKIEYAHAIRVCHSGTVVIYCTFAPDDSMTITEVDQLTEAQKELVDWDKTSRANALVWSRAWIAARRLLPLYFVEMLTEILENSPDPKFAFDREGGLAELFRALK